MDWTSAKLVQVISYLLPGFVAAWVYYGLTAHPKKSPFERVVQALIFTVFVQSATIALRWGLLFIGKSYPLGTWTPEVTQVWSMVNGVLIGLRQHTGQVPLRIDLVPFATGNQRPEPCTLVRSELGSVHLGRSDRFCRHTRYPLVVRI